jgi:hypothetical protein
MDPLKQQKILDASLGPLASSHQLASPHSFPVSQFTFLTRFPTLTHHVSRVCGGSDDRGLLLVSTGAGHRNSSRIRYVLSALCSLLSALCSLVSDHWSLVSGLYWRRPSRQ